MLCLWLRLLCSDECYSRIKQTIKEGVENISGVEFAETNELGRINRVDPLGITYLRVRGMWGIDNPWSVFSYVYQRDMSKKFNFMCIINENKWNTFDLDVFGPTAWHQGLYLSALKAGAEMAEFLGESDKAAEYSSIYKKGREFTNKELFNGEYFIQKIDLTDKSILNTYSINEDDLSVYWSDELGEIKYQTGEGSSIDQLCGQWHANILGLGRIFDKDKTDSALRAMYKYNFQKKLRDYDNTWRIYALNDEGGAVICAYPEGAKRPQVPTMYTEECMSGFEYELAELLISEGEYDKGIELVRAIRNRFNGKKRNPFSEIECGSNYARSMASFALLPIISGFEFDLPRGIIGFSPKTDIENFNCPWFLGTGWGSVNITTEKTEISLSKGEIKIKEIRLPYLKKVQRVTVDGHSLQFTFENG